jgi:hypothetical protein
MWPATDDDDETGELRNKNAFSIDLCTRSTLPTVFCVCRLALAVYPSEVTRLPCRRWIDKSIANRDRTGTAEEMMMWDVLMRLNGRTETLDRATSVVDWILHSTVSFVCVSSGMYVHTCRAYDLLAVPCQASPGVCLLLILSYYYYYFYFFFVPKCPWKLEPILTDSNPLSLHVHAL